MNYLIQRKHCVTARHVHLGAPEAVMRQHLTNSFVSSVMLVLLLPAFSRGTTVTDLQTFIAQTGTNSVATGANFVSPSFAGVMDSLVGQRHSFWFKSSGSSPNFFGTMVEFTVSFPSDVSAFGFVPAAFAGDIASPFTWTLYSASGDIVAIGSVSAASVFASGFLGVISSAPFRSVTVGRSGSGTGAYMIDDFRFVVLPVVAPTVTDNQSGTHIFAEFADGRLSDGTLYRSTLMVSSAGTASIECTATLTGLTVPGFGNGSTNTFSLGPRASTIIRTAGVQSFRSGYATLNCAAPVAAQVLYSYISPSGALLSEATVFSSPPGIVAQLVADQRNGARLGVAIANISDSPTQFLIQAMDQQNTEIGRTVVQVPARSQIPKFIDELINVPPDFIGQVLVSTTAPAGGTVYVIGLRYTGPVFTTIPPMLRAK
jgi:hypothetical protein